MVMSTVFVSLLLIFANHALANERGDAAEITYSSTSVLSGITKENTYLIHDALLDSGHHELSIKFENNPDDIGKTTLSVGKEIVFQHSDFRPALEGVCLDAGTNTIAFLYSSRSPGIGMTEQLVLSKDTKTHKWRTLLLPDYMTEESSVTEFTRCESGQDNTLDSKSSKKNIVLCKCHLEPVLEVQSTANMLSSFIPNEVSENKAILNLPNTIEENKYYPLPLLPLENLDQFDLFIETLKHTDDYEISRFQYLETTFLNIVKHQDTYTNIGYTFIKSGGRWFIFYVAGDSSKGFHPITEESQPKPHLLNMKICIRDCNWWGEKAWVQLDLKNLTLRKIGNIE